MKHFVRVLLLGFLLLFATPAVVSSAHGAAVTGLEGAYWLGTFFGSPAPTWPSCPTTPVPSPPAGVPSGTPPTVTETDPTISFGASTGFYWDESYPATVPPTPGYPGGFAVTQGGYGVAAASWGDTNLYSDYPTSTYFVNTDFSVEWTGWIYLTADTTYYFQLQSDDGSALYVNPTQGSSTISSADLVTNNWSTHAPEIVTSSGFTPTTTGNYAIEVDYFETCDTQSGIDLLWSTSPSSGFTIIPTDVFTPAAIGSNAPVVPPSVPQFGLAVPVVAALGLLAVAALLRIKTTNRSRNHSLTPNKMDSSSP